MPLTKKLIPFLFGILQLSRCDGFALLLPTSTYATNRIVLNGRSPFNGMALFGVKRKMSMAEKRKLRQAKQRRLVTMPENLPPSTLDFKSATPAKDEDAPLRVKDPTEAANQAKELLKAQRESVDMLTLVRQKVENLPVDEIVSALAGPDEYFVVDGFLNDEDVIDRIVKESNAMYNEEQMETDMANIGSGEYIVSIKGGKEQYAFCPRLVELVVSMTKHIPEAITSISLDPSACMATLRAFDRTALKASLALLTGEDDDNLLEQTPRQFGKLATEENDKRRLSAQYYILPDMWEESYGGGLEFETGGSVAAKPDRLVLWKSDSAMYRKQPWKGTDENCIGGCIELHLVAAA